MTIEVEINGKKLIFPKTVWKDDTLVGYNDNGMVSLSFSEKTDYEIKIVTKKDISASTL